MNHQKLYREIQANPVKREPVAVPSAAECVKLDERACKAESAERAAWAHYRSVEVEVRTALLSAEYLTSPQAEARYTVLEMQRYKAEAAASTASGRAREARRQADVAQHDCRCAAARQAFYEGTVSPLTLRELSAREVAA